jgi:hypothetical protein
MFAAGLSECGRPMILQIGPWTTICAARLALCEVLDVVQVNGPLIREVVEHIGGVHGVTAALLEAEDEVDPLVQTL